MIVKQVKFVNLSPDNRVEYGLATIPFAPGEWFGAPSLATLLRAPAGRPFFLKGFGAKYPDGSYRYAQGYFPLTLSGHSEQVAHVEIDSTNLPAPIEAPPIQLPVQMAPPILINGVGPQAMTMEILETNPARTVLLIKYRIQNFVVKVHAYLYKDQNYLPIEVRVIGSNPSNTLAEYPVESITLNVPGVTVRIYGAARRGVQQVTADTLILATNTYFGDGQSQCWYGNVYLPNPNPTVNPMAAEINPLYGISLDWKESKAFGPYGTIPEATTNIRSQKELFAAQSYSQFSNYKNSAGNMWDQFPEGLTKVPGATGDQRDFGMMTAWDAMDSERPELLEKYRFSAIQDALRPGHYCELDCRAVTSAAHPDWVTWSGTTHWHPNLSPDRLGKLAGTPASSAHGWAGKDVEHWSSNLLAAASVLTYSYQLLDELNTEAELFLSGHTIPSMKPNYSTNSIFAARAIGRTYHAMAQNYLITGREEIKTRVERRTIECVQAQWAGHIGGIVTPLKHIGPDYRQLPLYDSWLGWQEAIGASGLESWYQITSVPLYRDLAIQVSESFVKWAWRITEDPSGNVLTFNCGQGIRWYPDGHPITPEQYFDTTQTYFNPSDIMHVWTVSALKNVAERYQGLVAPEVQLRAGQLLQMITASRTGVYDRMGEWLV